MKRRQLFKWYFIFPLLFIFSMLIFGCGDKGASKGQNEKVASKQPSEKNSIHTSEAAGVKKGNSLDTGETESIPINDLIQLERWQQLVDELKNTLGDMEKMQKKVLQNE